MLQKVNRIVFVLSIVCALIAVVALVVHSAILMLLSTALLPKIAVGGVVCSAVLWVIAQYRQDDGAVRAATGALAGFAVCTLLWLIQLFSMLRVLL